MSSNTSFKNEVTNKLFVYIYIFIYIRVCVCVCVIVCVCVYVCGCVCKHELTLDNLEGLICHKTPTNNQIYFGSRTILSLPKHQCTNQRNYPLSFCLVVEMEVSLVF